MYISNNKCIISLSLSIYIYGNVYLVAGPTLGLVTGITPEALEPAWPRVRPLVQMCKEKCHFFRKENRLAQTWIFKGCASQWAWGWPSHAHSEPHPALRQVAQCLAQG